MSLFNHNNSDANNFTKFLEKWHPSQLDDTVDVDEFFAKPSFATSNRTISPDSSLCVHVIKEKNRRQIWLTWKPAAG